MIYNSDFVATKDKSYLIKATGYWSLSPVFFSQEEDKIIIIDDKLTVADFKPMIEKHLEAFLKDDLIAFIQSKTQKHNKSLVELITTTNVFNNLFFRLISKQSQLAFRQFKIHQVSRLAHLFR